MNNNDRDNPLEDILKAGPLPAPAEVPTISAVMCAQCKDLHSVDSLSYILIEGTITRRYGKWGQAKSEAQNLGLRNKPTVLCAGGMCLMQFLKIAD